VFLKGKTNTHRFSILHFLVGSKGEIILLANLVYFMYAWYRDVTLLAYVGFVFCLCMQYVGNCGARKGRSMVLGGVG
jgi:hypothetical protein